MTAEDKFRRPSEILAEWEIPDTRAGAGVRMHVDGSNRLHAAADNLGSAMFGTQTQTDARLMAAAVAAAGSDQSPSTADMKAMLRAVAPNVEIDGNSSAGATPWPVDWPRKTSLMIDGREVAAAMSVPLGAESPHARTARARALGELGDGMERTFLAFALAKRAGWGSADAPAGKPSPSAHGAMEHRASSAKTAAALDAIADGDMDTLATLAGVGGTGKGGFE